jgi:hypothetical protein
MKLAFVDFSTCERSTTTVGYAEAHDVPNFTPTEVMEMGTPRVSCDFESGNACAIDLELSGEVWHVRFASDPHGGTETLWFYFRVDGDKDDRFRLKEMMHEQPFRVAQYSSRWDERGTFSRWMWDSFAVPALVFEVPYSKSRGTLLTIEHYRELGSGLLEGLIEWAKRFRC